MHHLVLFGAVAGLVSLLLTGFIYERLSRRRDALRFPPIGQLVDFGGRRLHFFSKGTQSPTVVIEQGAGGPSLTWLRLQEEVAEFTRVCIYDRAGYQWSDAVSSPRSLQSRVEDLHTLLVNAALPGPFVLVAHSYGGFLVRLFAREYPALVTGIVLVDTPHEESYCRPEVLSFYSKVSWMLRAMKLLASFGVPRLLNHFLAKPDPTLPLEVSRQLDAGMVRREYIAAASDDIASLQRSASWLVKPDAFSPLGDLPLAVITHGKPFPGPFEVLERDWRRGQERLAALSTNSVLLVAENANHLIHQDQPEVVIQAIRQVVTSARTQEPAATSIAEAKRLKESENANWT